LIVYFKWHSARRQWNGSLHALTVTAQEQELLTRVESASAKTNVKINPGKIYDI